MAVRPVLSRPADLAYVVFFAMHLVATLLIDGQDLYPALVPAFLRRVRSEYIAQSGDPVLPHAFTPAFAWFTSLVWIEVLFQVPVFVLGIWALVRGASNAVTPPLCPPRSPQLTLACADDRRFYPLLIIYGTEGCVSTLQCVWMVLFGPARSSLTTQQLGMLLSSYLPFCILPGVLAIDLGLRTAKLLSSAAPPPRADKASDAAPSLKKSS